MTNQEKIAEAMPRALDALLREVAAEIGVTVEFDALAAARRAMHQAMAVGSCSAEAVAARNPALDRMSVDALVAWLICDMRVTFRAAVTNTTHAEARREKFTAAYPVALERLHREMLAEDRAAVDESDFERAKRHMCTWLRDHLEDAVLDGLADLCPGLDTMTVEELVAWLMQDMRDDFRKAMVRGRPS